MSTTPILNEHPPAVAERSVRRSRARELFVDPGRWEVIRRGADLVALLVGPAVGVVLAPGASHPGNVSMAAAFVAFSLLLLFARTPLRKRLVAGILDACASAVASCAIAAMVTIAAGAVAHAAPSNLLVLRLWLLSAGLLCAARTALGIAERRARAKGLLMTPTLIVGAGIVGSWVVRRLEQQPALGLRPIGFLDTDPGAGSVDGEPELPVLGEPTEALEIARRTGARELIFAFSWERDRRLAEVVRRCQAAGLKVAVVPRLYETINERATLEHIGGLPLMSFTALDAHGWQFTVKYAIERAFATIALLGIGPLMLAIAAAIRLTSPGPVVYRQRRVGRDGVEFDLLKFRTMTDEDPVAGFSPALGIAPGGVEGDDRRTAVGRWLRDSSLDELPQLLNVLRGEMSLIGPRPERPEFTARFAEDIPGYADRHRVKPGMTGWAQVNGLRGQTSIADRVEWDNHYIDNWSLRLELRILALTIAAVLSFREQRSDTAAAPDAGPPPSTPPTKPRLTVLGGEPEVAPDTAWFCGYCGAAPSAPPTPVSRVCAECGAGLLLEAPGNVAPAPGDAFIVVDPRLTVQALSRHAERVLGISEEDATDLPITDLITDADAELEGPRGFATALIRTALSDEEGWSTFVRPNGDFGIRIRARIGYCGPPRAALIVLEPCGTPPRLRLVDIDAGRSQARQQSL